MSDGDEAPVAAQWLLLIHQIPPKPDYLRVKIGRRLQRIGAVPVKNSVYALPDRPASLEDFQWIRAEIIEGDGDASVCKAAFVDGLTDLQLEHLFREARNADYVEIAADARALGSALRRNRSEPLPPRAEDDLARLRKRFAAVTAIDFFGAAHRATAEDALRVAAQMLESAEQTPAALETPNPRAAEHRGRTWVTRSGIFVDRIASAWLIRRFIDPEARFMFTTSAVFKPRAGELRFDMFEGEFTHDGNRCTFEVLLARSGLADPALHVIAEIVHDIDMKDAKFGREDAAGIERVLTAIATAHAEDVPRLDRGSQLFDELYALFSADARCAS